MKELDLLKKDWKKNENSFEQVSEIEIYKMLHTRSSSVVKWILIVSILEFIILNGIGFLLNDKDYDTFLNLHPFINYLEKINYFVIIGFIYLFYRNYKAICVLDSSKKLIEVILKTRKVVTYYIFWNMFIGGFSGALAGIEGWNAAGNLNKEGNIEINGITLLISMILLMGFIWLFYKLLYGRFLSNLKKNYKELKKLDL